MTDNRKSKNALAEKDKRSVNRYHSRALSWAAKQPQGELALHFAGIFTLYMLHKKSYREALAYCDQLTAIAQAAGGEYAEAAAKLNEQRRFRQLGASRKKARDPKQAAKAAALELWKERHAGERPDLRTVEQFAIEVMRMYPILESAKTIAGWSAKWTKQARAGETPTC